MIRIGEWIGRWDSLFPALADLSPWEVLATPGIWAGFDSDYAVEGEVAVHRSATIEAGAVIKGPAVIGPHAFIASGAYIRGGAWIGERCTVGPGSELKTSILIGRVALAHFNFVGDSILGDDVNLEAGAVIANHRNERNDRRIRISHRGTTIDTGVDKFGALVGDRARIGANAVIAPGALIDPGTCVPRLSLLDQGG